MTAGEALVSVPLTACVTHDLALATPAVAELLSSLPPDELEPHVSMAVWLMHARVHQPCGGHVASVLAVDVLATAPQLPHSRSWPAGPLLWPQLASLRRAAPRPELKPALPRGLLGLSAPPARLRSHRRLRS